MSEINIQLDGLVARRGLQQTLSKLQNLRPAFASMGEYMMRRTDDNFRGEHDPDGAAWAPLSGAYLKRKKGTKILTESGRLRSSITYHASNKEVILGTNVKYARSHFFGYPKRNLPARPFLGASERDLDNLAEILMDYLKQDL